MSLDIAITHRLGDFSLQVAFTAPAGVTALFGHSGAGKTTVVNAVAGLLRPHQGRISLDDTVLFESATNTAVPVHQRRIGYVFQDGRLFPHLTVTQNLRFGNWFMRHRTPSAEFDRVVALLGIEPLLARRPGFLSGGEKQRVAIGRALLAAPRLLLMDEPLASLDDTRKSEILPYLERLRDETRIPILYVSHSVAEVARLATTIVTLADGEVVRAGPAADILSDPKAFPATTGWEAGAIWQAQVVNHDPKDHLTQLSVSGGKLWVQHVNAAPGDRVRVRMRARDILLASHAPQGLSALNTLPATVRDITLNDDGAADVRLRCGEDVLLARITARSVHTLGLTPGMACYVVLKSIAVGRADIGAFADGGT